MLAPEEVRALADRLVGTPSVSPDPPAEARCARVLASCLPPRLEHGTWPTPDGRPVVWARHAGRTRRTLVMLGHLDTVGIGAFAALGPESLAFEPDALAARLRLGAGDRGPALAPAVLADLEEEARAPGTWRFGRGMLDMKSGLAAGIAALESLAAAPEPPEAGVLFVVTPDEEHLSSGMRVAARELARLREQGTDDFAGVINLDYGLEPAVYTGVEGKLELGCWVLGSGAHVSDPSRAPDAITVAAAVVAAVVRCRAGSGLAPTPLGFDDLKRGYSIEPATETLVEFSVPWSGEPLGTVIESFRTAITSGLAGALGPRSVTDATTDRGWERGVWTFPQLLERGAGGRARPVTALARADLGEAGAARAETIARLRLAAAAARIEAPAVILHLLPPFYPPASPKGSRLVEAAAALARAEGLALPGRYPFISDASYVAWRAPGSDLIAHHLPALEGAYRLPIDAAASLDLDVVNLGPWGRDAHALCERVHARYAFERLPRVIERLVREAGRE